MRCRCLWLSCRLPCNATLVVLPKMAMQQQPLESQARSFEQVPSPKVPADDAGGAAQPASPSGDGDSDVAAFLIPNTGAASSLDAAPAPVSADELSKLGLELDPEPMSHTGDIDIEDSAILEDLTQLSLNNKLKCIKPYGGADQPARKQDEPYDQKNYGEIIERRAGSGRANASSAARPASDSSQPWSTSSAAQPAQLEEACKLSTDTAGDSPSGSMERGLFLRTSFGNLGERPWFTLRMVQLAGNPTHNCLKCLNRLAWTCKQIHTWFYTNFDIKATDIASNESAPEEEEAAQSTLSSKAHHTRSGPLEPVKPKAPPPTINCVVCGRACGYPHRAPIWSKDERPVPTCGGICLLTWYDSNTPWPADLVWLEHSPHVDSDSDALQPASAERPVDHSTQSSAGRPASLSSDVESTMPKAAQSFLLPTNAELTRAEIDCLGPQKPSPARYPQARAPPEDLDRRMRKRYHPPGCPSNTCTSLQLGGTTWAGAPRHNNSGSAERPASSDQQVSINTPKQNSSGSAEQFAPSRAAVSSVPVHSPDRNTGFRHSQFNPQSGDLVPPWVAGRAKPPPPALPPNSLLPLQWMNGARDTVHNVTSFANGHLAPPESSDPRRNSQEPTFPPAGPFKAPPPLGPRRGVFFRQVSE